MPGRVARPTSTPSAPDSKKVRLVASDKVDSGVGLVVDVQGERASRFHEKTLDSLADIVAAAGLTHPGDLQPHHLMHRVGVNNARPIDSIYPFRPADILNDDPDATPDADWWRAASADSFSPRIDLAEQRARPDIN